MGGKVAGPTHLPGGAANAALMLASAGLANAFAHRGIRVNAVNPGLTETDRMQEGFAAEARQSGLSVEAMREKRLRAMPLGRIAQPQDIADMVVFLASRRANYVSGADRVARRRSDADGRLGLASSSALHDGEHTACARPSTLRVFIIERGRCLPHRKHDIVAAPKVLVALNGEPGVFDL